MNEVNLLIRRNDPNYTFPNITHKFEKKGEQRATGPSDDD